MWGGSRRFVSKGCRGSGAVRVQFYSIACRHIWHSVGGVIRIGGAI